MNATILGKRYRVVFERLPDDTNGECDHPETKHKQIRIDSALTGRPLLETELHELLHAGFWSLDETHVAEWARDVSRYLWQRGYKCAQS